MVFYMNTGTGTEESILIEPTRPDDDTAMLLVSEFQYLHDYDFKNFNIFSFEQDITDMSAGDFEWWYKYSFYDWLESLNKDYLDIGFEDIYYKFNTQDEKRVFLLKVVNFIMFLLPYQLLKQVFKKLEFSSYEEIQDYLMEDANLISLREEIIEAIDSNMIQFDTFVDTLTHFEKVAKKNLVEENIALLDDHVKKQNFFFEIFKGIIHETDMEKIKNIILLMLENDAKNIL